jgi:hypothetical protein
VFASKSLTVHLARGAIGLGTLAAASALAPLGWPLLVLLPVALIALRGCPMCWTIGLLQTAWARLRRDGAAKKACLDGSCTVLDLTDRRGRSPGSPMPAAVATINPDLRS